MSWLATRPLAVLGAFAGALVGAVTGAFSVVLVRSSADVGLSSSIVPLIAAVAVGMLAGRLAVVGLERDQRALARRARRRDGAEPEFQPMHREATFVARSIDGLQAQVAGAEIARSDAVDQLETVVDGLRDGVIVVDEQLSTVSMNRAAAELLDVPRRPSIGQSLVVVTRDADIVRVVREAVDGRPVQALPIDYRRSGRQLTVQVQVVRGRRRSLVIVVLQDVTEIRRLESVRRDFVANVSHELRTPLASIRALAETLEAGAMDDAEVGPDFVRRIVGEVDRMTTLVDGLIDLGRLQAGRMSLYREPTMIGAVIDDVVGRLRPQVEDGERVVTVELAPGLPPIDVDRIRIDQVLTNLLHNAIKFTAPGGKITVSAGCRDGAIAIDVCDTGVGIAPDEVERVFERFYKSDQSRHSSGTGLGLSIAKHIVLAHGGSIRASSELGVGSTFTVELPIAS
jgi:two-component system phosphate regulon sensor histidine kinase PhoR